MFRRGTFKRLCRVQVKDRVPFPGTDGDAAVPKIAMLIDGHGIDPVRYLARVEPPFTAMGTVCLRRVFAQQKESKSPGYERWESAITATRSVPSATGAKSSEVACGFERFMVDDFMPVHIQMAADAAHLIDCAVYNKLTAVCLAVPHVLVEKYAEYLERLRNSSVTVYVGSEEGIHQFATPR